LLGWHSPLQTVVQTVGRDRAPIVFAPSRDALGFSKSLHLGRFRAPTLGGGGRAFVAHAVAQPLLQGLERHDASRVSGKLLDREKRSSEFTFLERSSGVFHPFRSPNAGVWAVHVTAFREMDLHPIFVARAESPLHEAARAESGLRPFLAHFHPDGPIRFIQNTFLAVTSGN
jgi:hypothetical protein